MSLRSIGPAPDPTTHRHLQVRPVQQNSHALSVALIYYRMMQYSGHTCKWGLVQSWANVILVCLIPEVKKVKAMNFSSQLNYLSKNETWKKKEEKKITLRYGIEPQILT